MSDAMTIVTTLPALHIVELPTHDTVCATCGGQVWDAGSGVPFCSACGAMDIGPIQAQSLAMEYVRAQHPTPPVLETVTVIIDAPDHWAVMIETTTPEEWLIQVTRSPNGAYSCAGHRVGVHV
ncbi:MAG: hypothetical protein KGH75_00535 [Rhodospirillales bacterium]|nr:hypothetical protein [Rhodospirillales bacterium]